jgi:uncharacterized protein YggU (UPF0235/DUF167 family)
MSGGRQSAREHTKAPGTKPARARLLVKAVPGAKRDEIAGPLGTRLKVRTAAPPEGGKANATICALVAAALGLRPRAVRVVAGHSHAEKELEIEGASPEAIASLWSAREQRDQHRGPTRPDDRRDRQQRPRP